MTIYGPSACHPGATKFSYSYKSDITQNGLVHDMVPIQWVFKVNGLLNSYFEGTSMGYRANMNMEFVKIGDTPVTHLVNLT